MRRFFRIIFIGGLLVALGGGGFVYLQAFRDNVDPSVGEQYELLVPAGAGYAWVAERLEQDHVLKSTASFDRVAEVRGYKNLVKPGRYVIRPGMNNWELVQKLRAGEQDQMRLTFRSHRTLDGLAGEIAAQVAFDSTELFSLMQNDAFLAAYDLNAGTVRNLFIPNTYFVYWTLAPKELFDRMKKHFDEFWNADRRAKAEALGMSIHKVVTLASIVQAETYLPDERPRVAGLYLNRLRDGIPLQADPTVIFAHGDFSIRRVLKSHLEIDSPYNTYKYAGLPPGPINNPEASSIDGVLNYEKHSYYYMCAKADFSGYHNFSKTLSQHNRYAREYQRALNRQRVYR